MPTIQKTEIKNFYIVIKRGTIYNYHEIKQYNGKAFLNLNNIYFPKDWTGKKVRVFIEELK